MNRARVVTRRCNSNRLDRWYSRETFAVKYHGYTNHVGVVSAVPRRRQRHGRHGFAWERYGRGACNAVVEYVPRVYPAGEHFRKYICLYILPFNRRGDARVPGKRIESDYDAGPTGPPLSSKHGRRFGRNGEPSQRFPTTSPVHHHLAVRTSRLK